MRMGIRRFTQLTNAFSKKLENHFHSLSLYFVHYYFIKIHGSIKFTPAIEAELTDTLHDMEWILQLINANAPKPNRPKTYKEKDFKVRHYREGKGVDANFKWRAHG